MPQINKLSIVEDLPATFELRYGDLAGHLALSQLKISFGGCSVIEIELSLETMKRLVTVTNFPILKVNPFTGEVLSGRMKREESLKELRTLMQDLDKKEILNG